MSQVTIRPSPKNYVVSNTGEVCMFDAIYRRVSAELKMCVNAPEYDVMVSIINSMVPKQKCTIKGSKQYIMVAKEQDIVPQIKTWLVKQQEYMSKK